MFAGFLFCLVGCGTTDRLPGEKPVYPTRGVVTYRGKSLPDATVRLHPVETQGVEVIPRGSVESDSGFALTTYRRNDGAPAGQYNVSVSWLGPLNGVSEDAEDRLKERLPNKYTNPRTSGIKVTIAEGENELPPIDLK